MKGYDKVKPIFFWKHPGSDHAQPDGICAGIYENLEASPYALSLKTNELLKHLSASVNVKVINGKKCIVAKWGGTKTFTKFLVPENGQIKAKDELREVTKTKKQGPRSLVFKETPVNLNLQLLMLDN
jgi:hypothetical protein